jgi:hypothetical protein
MMKSGKPKKTKRPGSDRRWTLLFIGDHGNVITLKRFKAIVLVTVFVFLLTIGAMAVLIFLNAGFQKENQEFKKRIADSQKRIETLRHEKEILMARLVLSETKIKESVSMGQQGRVQENTTKQIEEKVPPAPKLETSKVNKKKPATPQLTQTVASGSETRDNAPVFSVAVENFIVSHASNSADLNAQFKIKNTSPESRKVAGHAVVVLKSKDLPKHKWLVMPAVGLVGDEPSGKRGKRFSIQRFRTMNLTSKTPKHSDEFQTAAVYVYLKSGKLLLVENFPVELPPLPVSEAQTPSVSASSTETHSVDRLATQAPSTETPSTETSPIDDAADSFENTPAIY